MRIVTSVIALGVSACGSQEVVVGDLHEVTSMKAIPNRDLDVLFVIDKSFSMIEHQEQLGVQFPIMMDALGQLDGGMPNLHIGVVSTDLGLSTATSVGTGEIAGSACVDAGDDGMLLRNATELTNNFISDVTDASGTRVRNYTGELRDVFAKQALLGPEGCGFEQPLAAMRKSLTHPMNAGFLRPNANLAVVFVTDEDDCSALDPMLFDPHAPIGVFSDYRCTKYGIVCDGDDTETPGPRTGCRPRSGSALVEDVQPFVDALLAVKPDPRMIMTAAIAGDLSPFEIQTDNNSVTMLAPSCSRASQGGHGDAIPAVRLAAFLDAFPDRSQLTSICSPDLSAPLGMIGASAKRLMGDPCLVAPDLADTSAAPGLQPTCEVVDVRDSAPDAPTVLPACEPGATDCYEIVSDPQACPSAPDNLRVRVTRSSVTDDTWTHVRCQRAASE